MATYTIDTLTTAQDLKQAGFKTEQAEAVAKAIAHQGEQLVTKSDIDGVRREVAGLRWMFGIQFALTLLILARVFNVIGAGV